VESALGSSNELRRLESQIAAKGLEGRAAKAARLPRVDLVAQYGLFATFNHYQDYFLKYQRNNAEVGVSFQLPLLPGRECGAAAAEADADASKLRIQLANTRNQITADTRQSYREVRKAEAAAGGRPPGSGRGARTAFRQPGAAAGGPDSVEPGGGSRIAESEQVGGVLRRTVRRGAGPLGPGPANGRPVWRCCAERAGRRPYRRRPSRSRPEPAARRHPSRNGAAGVVRTGCNPHLDAVKSQQLGFIEIDGFGVLTNIAGVVNAAGQFLKVAALDSLQAANVDFRRFRDLLQRNAPIPPYGSQAQDASIFFLHQPGSP
jgi:hypothetical protein